MRQARDIPSELDSSEFRSPLLDEMILSMASEIALERMRRRVKPRVYQIWEMYVDRGWSVGEVSGFLGAGAVEVWPASVRCEFQATKHRPPDFGR